MPAKKNTPKTPKPKNAPISDLAPKEDNIPRKRGRPKGTGGNKRPDIAQRNAVHVKPGENAHYLSHSLKLAKLPKISLKDETQVEARIIDYFQICADDDIKPSVVGLALALGTDRTHLWELRTGKSGKNPAVADLLKKAATVLELQLNDYMQNGKINPVAGIFLGKVHFGYVESQEIVVTPNVPLGEAKDPELLAAEYTETVTDE